MFEDGSALQTLMLLGYLASSPLGDPHDANSFNVRSSALNANQNIPTIYTCQGANISIPVQWSGVPKGTKSLALVMYDQDSPWPGFFHWEVFDIPPNTKGFSPNTNLAKGEFESENSWGNKTYQGPCPPHGEHHYVLRLYALNKKLPESADKSPLALHENMQPYIIAWTQTVGHYENRRDDS